MQLLTLFILKDIEKMYQGQDVGCLSNEVITFSHAVGNSMARTCYMKLLAETMPRFVRSDQPSLFVIICH